MTSCNVFPHGGGSSKPIVVMAALRSRCGHYIFAVVSSSSTFLFSFLA